MTCYKPLHGFASILENSNGKRSTIFDIDSPLANPSLPRVLPCGRCIGCRLARSGQWAVRCMHEASLSDNNCFITLTFDEKHLPFNLTLDHRDHQLFMKRLRKKFGPKIRFYHCGEYGDTYGRPHYHTLLFNFDFPDKEIWRIRDGQPLYRSPSLESLWPYGFSSIGAVTFESAAYVARYCMKKITGPMSDDHYLTLNPVTGELFKRVSEYNTMSRRPGIAKMWYTKYYKDVYPEDFVVMNGHKVRPPRYYDSQYELEFPNEYLELKSRREDAMFKLADDNTPERLEVREICKSAAIGGLVRSIHSES